MPGTHLLEGEAREAFAAGIASAKFPGTGSAEFPGAALETRPGDLIIFNIHGAPSIPFAPPPPRSPPPTGAASL